MKSIEDLIDTAIKEDIGAGDLTTLACVPEEATATGCFFLKQAGVIAGLPCLEMLYKKIDPRVEITLLIEEGTFHKAGTMIAKIAGPARGVLSGERIAINLIQHASGVATITTEYVKKMKGLSCDVLDTRKTLPGLRALEKYAVHVVGGKSHREGLFDIIVIKTNHLCFVSNERNALSISEAVRRAKEAYPHAEVEIEITQFDQLNEVLKTDAGVIILSKMPPELIKKCVKEIKKSKKKVYLDSSLASITLSTIRAYAETGVDAISVSTLTHSVQAIEIGMRLYAN